MYAGSSMRGEGTSPGKCDFDDKRLNSVSVCDPYVSVKYMSMVPVVKSLKDQSHTQQSGSTFIHNGGIVLRAIPSIVGEIVLSAIPSRPKLILYRHSFAFCLLLETHERPTHSLHIPLLSTNQLFHGKFWLGLHFPKQWTTVTVLLYLLWCTLFASATIFAHVQYM